MRQKWFIRQMHPVMLFTTEFRLPLLSRRPPAALYLYLRKLTPARPPRKQH